MGNKTIQNSKFTTLNNNQIDTEGNSTEFLETLNKNIMTWLKGFSRSITSRMSESEIEYLVNHMSHSDDDGHLFRLEPSHHLEKWLNEGNGVGDLLKDNDLFRSFSRNSDASGQMLKDGWVLGDIVIYRTIGDTPFFDPRPFADPFPEQKEAFVPLDCMRVEGIHHFEPDEFKRLGRFMGTSVLDDVEDTVGGVDEYTDSVTVVDVRFDPNVKNVVVDGHNIDVSGL